jgi:chromosome segregation ATPase
MMSAVEGPENLGPLEATISHVTKELETKATEGKEMQRRWVGFQVELVALVADNNGLSEAVQRLKSERTVMTQRRNRLNEQYDAAQRYESSLGDAESSLGDAKSSLGDAEGSLGDAKSSLGDAQS